MNITANSYYGRYGRLGDMANIIHVNISYIEPDIAKTIYNKPYIVLAIDISGSMEESMKNVISSLLAFRDAIVGKSHKYMDKLTPEARDNILRDKVNLRLITFSNTAQEVWSNESEDTFEDIVINLDTEAMTNMGDALNLALSDITYEDFCWVIVMTDGESNTGPQRTSQSFYKLVKEKKPDNCKIISLGYGDRFDPEILNIIGTFVYVNNSEMIPVVLGNIAYEITNAQAYNLNILLNNRHGDDQTNNNRHGDDQTNNNRHGDDQTNNNRHGDDQTNNNRANNNQNNNRSGSGLTLSDSSDSDIIDITDSGTFQKPVLEYNQDLVNERHTDILVYNYDYVVISHDTEITVTWYDMTNNYNSCKVVVNNTDEPLSEKIINLYYEHEKRRILNKLYRVVNKCTKYNCDLQIENIKNDLLSWDCDISEPHKDEIIKLIQDIQEKQSAKRNHILSDSVGSGYNIRTKASDITLNSSGYYMMSPLVNSTRF
jgi:hypothetical protein